MNNKYIAIEGVIGVGKTTLARLLQPRYDASTLLEVVEDNPFLSKFYQDRERFAFQTQIFFLLSRYHQQYQAIPAALRRGNLVADYTFANGLIIAPGFRCLGFNSLLAGNFLDLTLLFHVGLLLDTLPVTLQPSGIFRLQSI